MCPLVKIQGNRNSKKCVTRFSMIGPLVIKGNEGWTDDLISIYDAIVKIIGKATFLDNTLARSIILFYSCTVIFYKNVSFINNGISDLYTMDSVIMLHS